MGAGLAQPVLQLHEWERRVEVREVTTVARDDDVIVEARTHDDGGVNNIVGARPPAESARGAGSPFVQRDHSNAREAQEPCQARLTRRPSPGLAENTGRNGERPAGRGSLIQQGLHPPARPLDGHQCAGVKGRTGHR